jgi:hypothetical protein
MSVRVVIALACLCLGTAERAAGQEQNRLAIGVSINHRGSTDPLAHGDVGVGIKWRVGHGEPGWGWHYGLSWYETHLDRSVDRRDVRFGDLRIRPLMGGYGYTHAIGARTLATVKVLGGFAFSGFHSEPDGNGVAPHVRTGFLTPVVKPEISVWHDVSEKFGVGVDIGYIIARPRLTMSGASSQESARFRADTLTLSAGVVYRILARRAESSE